MNKLGILEIKQAIWDDRFRALFPEHEKELTEYLKNPGCPCNMKLLRKLLQYPDRLKKYFPTKDVDVDIAKVPVNNMRVINCHVDKLEVELRKLPRVPKQIAIARYEDQVTVIYNEIEIEV